MRVQRVGDRTKQTRVAPHKMRDHPPDGMAWRLRYQECRISAAKEHGKNNFGETKVAITLRGMISRRYSEVVFPVFLRRGNVSRQLEQCDQRGEHARPRRWHHLG